MSTNKPTFQQEVQKAIEATAIDPNNISGAMLEQAHTFSQQSSRAALVRANLKRAEVQVKLLEAETSLRVRKSVANGMLEGGIKATEDSIGAVVRTDPAYTTMINQVEDLRQKSMVLDAVVEAMRQRSDMLIQLAADIRRERSQSSND